MRNQGEESTFMMFVLEATKKSLLDNIINKFKSAGCTISRLQMTTIDKFDTEFLSQNSNKNEHITDYLDFRTSAYKPCVILEAKGYNAVSEAKIIRLSIEDFENQRDMDSEKKLVPHVSKLIYCSESEISAKKEISYFFEEKPLLDKILLNLDGQARRKVTK